MKHRLINKEIKENYGENLLRERGVEDINLYLNPTESCIQDPSFLDNIIEGAKLLLDTIADTKKKVLLVVDSDNDGYTSAAIIYQYIKKLSPETSIDYWLHEAKQHGLEDHIDKLMDNGEYYSLIILPDASSNDFSLHERLKEINAKCLVLDHHITDAPISDNAIIVNNQISKDYENKELTGAGVVYQFCRFIDQNLGTEYANEFADLAAWGIIGDMGSVISLENRTLIKKGLEAPRNIFFRVLIDKQSYSMGGKLTPITIAFYIVPLINAMIRVGTMEEKERLFLAFVDGESKVVSKKRGAKGELELVAVESARECTNARTRQNSTKEKVVDALEAKIHKKGLLDNKVLLVRLEEDDIFPPVLNGLVAMQLSHKFKKPTIVARLNKEGQVRGSARGLSQSALKSFKNYLNETNFFEYTAGHDNAFGISIANKDLSAFHEMTNERLKDFDFGEDVYDVNFIRNSSDLDIADIVFDVCKYSETWGQSNDEPLIFIDKIILDEREIQIMGKNQDTVKFEQYGVTYMKFKAKEFLRELEEHNGKVTIQIIGRCNLNEWGGRTVPQIFIESYEIKNWKIDLEF